MLASFTVLKSFLLPPGVLVVAGLLGLALTCRARLRKRGLLLAAAAGLAAAMLALPVVSAALIGSLQVYPALPPDATALDADAIVVLAGDHRADLPEYGDDQPGALSLERCRYGAHLARRTGLPLALSGGVVRPDRPPLARTLARFVEDELGVAVRWREERSVNTRENARFTAELLRADGIARVALVTHAWHMARAARAFERAGLRVLPAPTAGASPPESFGMGLVPRAESFQLSVWALHEWLGRAWYALQGA